MALLTVFQYEVISNHPEAQSDHGLLRIIWRINAYSTPWIL